MRDMSLKLYDVIVIGGGINGAGIARDAAMRGLDVGLFEARDFACATSSSSSKLIHGGLRYLEYYEFSLVRKALKERKRLMNIAPHIIWPMEFTLPYEKHLRHWLLLRLGLFLYDFLAPLSVFKFSTAKFFSEKSALKSRIKSGFSYYDAWADDARLVLLNILSAKEHGAEIHKNTKVNTVSFNAEQGYYEVILNNGQTVHARTLVNAAGPWADEFFNKEAKLRLVKGSHIIVPQLFDEKEGAFILQNEDKRIVFAIPYEGKYTLIGTTDIVYKGDPYAVEISREEEDYLINISNHYFKKQLKHSDIVWRYSGVRPLLEDNADNPSAVTRDYRFAFERGRLDIFGGKLTTYRVLAKEAVDQLCAYLDVKARCMTDRDPLPGGHLEGLTLFIQQKIEQYHNLPAELIERYARTYGDRMDHIIAQLGDEIGEGVYSGELDYAIDEEYVTMAEDFLWRRTKLGLHLSEKTKDKIKAYIEGEKDERLYSSN